MKHFLFVLTFLISTSAFATGHFEEPAYYVNKCAGKDDEIIRQLETELSNCKVDMREVPSTADMNEAHYRYADCVIEVANKLFDHFYKQSNEQVKKNFNDLVKALYAQSHDVYQYSDFARVEHMGTMYNTMAISRGGNLIVDTVKEYLRYARIDCSDKIESGYSEEDLKEDF